MVPINTRLAEEFVLAFVLLVILEELIRLVLHSRFIFLPLVVDSGRLFARLKSLRLAIVSQSFVSLNLQALLLWDYFLKAYISVIAYLFLSCLLCCTLLKLCSLYISFILFFSLFDCDGWSTCYPFYQNPRYFSVLSFLYSSPKPFRLSSSKFPLQIQPLSQVYTPYPDFLSITQCPLYDQSLVRPAFHSPQPFSRPCLKSPLQMLPLCQVYYPNPSGIPFTNYPLQQSPFPQSSVPSPCFRPFLKVPVQRSPFIFLCTPKPSGKPPHHQPSQYQTNSSDFGLRDERLNQQNLPSPCFLPFMNSPKKRLPFGQIYIPKPFFSLPQKPPSQTLPYFDTFMPLFYRFLFRTIPKYIFPLFLISFSSL